MILHIANKYTLSGLWRKFTMEVGAVRDISNSSKRSQEGSDFAFYTKELPIRRNRVSG
jgi:hypothetical protein